MAQDGNARPAFKYSHQSGVVATTVIKSQPGTLRSVAINTAGATPSQITLADSATATTTPVIATIQPVANSTVNSCLIYDVVFNNGLAITMNGASNTADITISYI